MYICDFSKRTAYCNVCDVLYHPGSQHYSTLRYSKSWGNKTNIKWTLALAPFVFSPREPRHRGEPCMYMENITYFFLARGGQGFLLALSAAGQARLHGYSMKHVWISELRDGARRIKRR